MQIETIKQETREGDGTPSDLTVTVFNNLTGKREVHLEKVRAVFLTTYFGKTPEGEHEGNAVTAGNVGDIREIFEPTVGGIIDLAKDIDGPLGILKIGLAFKETLEKLNPDCNDPACKAHGRSSTKDAYTAPGGNA